MKNLLVFVMFLCSRLFVFAQEDFTTSLITPQILQEIKEKVEKEVLAFKNKLSAGKMSVDEIEFAVDTFKINRIALKRLDIDYTTLGMNTTMYQEADSYDKLLNKYYNRLMKSLKPDDKKTLITAQKSWLTFRDTEYELIKTLRKEEYSGGGTMQTTIIAGQYYDLIQKRTIDIFNYLNEIIKDK